ncbi:MAG: hypothetical protein MUC49_12820 [Raineya sp.]|jgi:hypothetical protein|nr:hypothetical protein [Raineya sp.]
MKKSVFILLFLFTNHLKAQKIIWGEATKKEYRIPNIFFKGVTQNKENYYFDITETALIQSRARVMGKDKGLIFSKKSLKYTEENENKEVSESIKIGTKQFRIVSYHETVNRKRKTPFVRVHNNRQAFYISETNNEGVFIEKSSPLFIIDFIQTFDYRSEPYLWILSANTKPNVVLAKDSSCIVVYNVVQQKDKSQIHFHIINTDYSVKDGIINLPKLYNTIAIKHLIVHNKNKLQFFLLLNEIEILLNEVGIFHTATYDVEKQKNDLVEITFMSEEVASFFRNNLFYTFRLTKDKVSTNYIQMEVYDSTGKKLIQKEYTLPYSLSNEGQYFCNITLNNKNQGLLTIENTVVEHYREASISNVFKKNVFYFLVDIDEFTFKPYSLLKNQNMGADFMDMIGGIKTVSDAENFYIFYNDHKKNAFLKEGANPEKYYSFRSSNFCIKVEPDGKTEKILLNVESSDNKKKLNPVMILPSIMYDKNEKLFYGIGMDEAISTKQKFNLFKIIF